MLEIDNIVLNQAVILSLVNVQYELPRHRNLFFINRQVYKVSNSIIYTRLWAIGFDWDSVGLISLNGFFIEIESLSTFKISDAYFLES
jgi:hypothetical protein